MKKILLSLHDVTPYFEHEIEIICRKFDELGAFHRTLLVVPDYFRKTPLREHREWCGKIAAMRESGTDLGLHGFYHEWGECGFLSYAEALKKVTWAKAEFQAGFGFGPSGFVAPQWFQSSGCKRALTELDLLYSGRWTGLFDRAGKRIHAAWPTNYDWGSSLLDRFFAWWNPHRLLAKEEGVIRMSFHPWDVRHGLFEEEAGLMKKLMDKGWSVSSYGDAAREAAE